MVTKVYYALANSNTWVDSSTQGLFVGKYDFPYPDVKKMTVDIPGRDGLLDLSESLTGEPVYTNVAGTIRFIILVGSTFNVDNFINTYHGKVVKFRTDEKPNYYRIGRATITKDDHYRLLRSFTITVDAEPLTWSTTESTKSLTTPAPDASVLTFSTSTNMATNYPTLSGSTITLKTNNTNTAGTAAYTVSVTSGRYYFLHFEMSGDADHVNIKQGNTIYTYNNLTGGIAFQAKASTITITFYTEVQNTTATATFSKITFGQMEHITDANIMKSSTPYIRSNRACNLYSLSYIGRITANADIAVPVNPADDYIGFGGATSAGTATLTYRGGVLS